MFRGENIVGFCIAFCFALIPYCCAYAQINDSTVHRLPKKNISFSRFLLNVITRRNADTSMQGDMLISKNESPFLPHQGKGIRHIIIKEFGFNKTLADSPENHCSTMLSNSPLIQTCV
jgi:hypothetical protein